MKKITIIGLLLIFGLVCFCVFLNYNHIEEKDVVVRSLVTKQEIRGSADTNTITTLYRYLVNTDKGTYYISPDGLYHSNCFGGLEEHKTYHITTRGYSVPFISMYPYIIDAYDRTRN